MIRPCLVERLAFRVALLAFCVWCATHEAPLAAGLTVIALCVIE